MEIRQLRRQLCTQESEFKSLERSCKVGIYIHMPLLFCFNIIKRKNGVMQPPWQQTQKRKTERTRQTNSTQWNLWQVMLAVKKKEITELREDCQRRDAALDDITAAARATRAASDEVTINLPLIPLILKTF